MDEQSPIAAMLAQASARRCRIRTQLGVTLPALAEKNTDNTPAGESTWATYITPLPFAAQLREAIKARHAAGGTSVMLAPTCPNDPGPLYSLAGVLSPAPEPANATTSKNLVPGAVDGRARLPDTAWLVRSLARRCSGRRQGCAGLWASPRHTRTRPGVYRRQDACSCASPSAAAGCWRSRARWWDSPFWFWVTVAGTVVPLAAVVGLAVAESRLDARS